jgi:hypothetical protein
LALVAYFFTVAPNRVGIVGSLALATALIKSLTVHWVESYSTRASCPSNTTSARWTPFTDSSADRTGSTQPCQVIPEMARVTAASLLLVGFAAPSGLGLAAHAEKGPATQAIRRSRRVTIKLQTLGFAAPVYVRSLYALLEDSLFSRGDTFCYLSPNRGQVREPSKFFSTKRLAQKSRAITA